MECYNKIFIKGHYFPCGHCMACKVNRTSEWTLRLCHELNSWSCASFVTLTYDDEHLPSDKGLHKKEVQNFMKRLRKYSKLKLRYYAVGEYGSKNLNENGDYKFYHRLGRPHYHLIIFGLDPLLKKHRDYVVEAWSKCPEFMFKWKRYKNAIDIVNDKDIAYVCGYVQKKLYGKEAENTYIGIQPPFSLMSKGLGKDYFLLNLNAVLNWVSFRLTAFVEAFRDITKKFSIFLLT